jgi:hypothetical protein
MGGKKISPPAPASAYTQKLLSKAGAVPAEERFFRGDLSLSVATPKANIWARYLRLQFGNSCLYCCADGFTPVAS